MSYKGSLYQSCLDSIPAVTEESIYIHPGNPEDDGNAVGEAAYRNIILKECRWQANDSNSRLYQITVVFRDGREKALTNREISHFYGAGLEAESSYIIPFDGKITNVRAIRFIHANAHASDTKTPIAAILYEPLG